MNISLAESSNHRRGTLVTGWKHPHRKNNAVMGGANGEGGGEGKGDRVE